MKLEKIIEAGLIAGITIGLAAIGAWVTSQIEDPVTKSEMLKYIVGGSYGAVVGYAYSKSIGLIIRGIRKENNYIIGKIANE